MHDIYSHTAPATAPSWRKCFALLVLVPAATACEGLFGPGEDKRDSLSISHTAFQLEIGERALVTATSSSTPASKPAFEWSSSDSRIAEIDGHGWITGTGQGVAHIRVEFGGYTDSATVRVGDAAASGSPAWRTVHAGDRFTCALDESGQRYCWGENTFGAHGSGIRRMYTATQSPVSAGDPLRYQVLSAGTSHACGITVDGTGYCWGNNAGNPSNYEVRPKRLEIPRALAAISSGLGHACALDVQGARYCWGSNLMGALGIPGAGTRQPTPMHANEEVRFAGISSGLAHTCGVSAAGEAFCWGTAGAGELGEGSLTGLRPQPHPVSGGLHFASVSAGNAGTCALTREGAVYCWGMVTLNDGSGPRRGESTVPLRLETDARFTQVSVGAGHACGRATDGAAYCWGLNEFGQAGVEAALGESCASLYVNGPVPCVSLPRPVSTTLRFRQISAGRMHTCGVTADSLLYCWGRNDAGQLGSGRLEAYSAQPVRVAAPL